MITGDLPLPFWPDWRFVGSLLAPPTTPFYRETTIQLSAVYSPQRTKTDSNRRAHQGGSSFQDWRITTLLLMQFASCFSRGDWQPQESFVWPQGLYFRSSIYPIGLEPIYHRSTACCRTSWLRIVGD